MDAYDFKEDPIIEEPKRKPGKMLLTLGTIYFVLSSALLIIYFLVIFNNPYSGLNPFPPPTPTLEAELQSQLPVEPPETELQDAAIPLPTSTPPPEFQEETPFPEETTTPYPTPTNVVLATETPPETEESPPVYVAQEESPSYLPYAGGCDGLYVAGNVFDIENDPVMLMTVRAVGVIGDQPVDLEALSGSDPDYAESGWEIKLSDALVNTSGAVLVALYRQGSREPFSEEVLIDTFNDCGKNLAVVNFVQERPE